MSYRTDPSHPSTSRPQPLCSRPPATPCTLCPAVHILGSQNVYSRAECIADYYWPRPVFSPFLCVGSGQSRPTSHLMDLSHLLDFHILQHSHYTPYWGIFTCPTSGLLQGYLKELLKEPIAVTHCTLILQILTGSSYLLLAACYLF